MINKLELHHLEALNRWIDAHGRNWKSVLLNAWFCGKYVGLVRDRDEATLQNLRYRIGPSGLKRLTTKSIRERRTSS